MDKLKGWHSRRYLPHFDGGEVTQFITFRLHDSLPQKILNLLEKQKTPEDDNLETQRRVEKYLDCSYGECYLKNPKIAEIVENKLFAMNNKEFRLKAVGDNAEPPHIYCSLLVRENHFPAKCSQSKARRRAKPTGF